MWKIFGFPSEPAFMIGFPCCLRYVIMKTNHRRLTEGNPKVSDSNMKRKRKINRRRLLLVYFSFFLFIESLTSLGYTFVDITFPSHIFYSFGKNMLKGNPRRYKRLKTRQFYNLWSQHVKGSWTCDPGSREGYRWNCRCLLYFSCFWYPVLAFHGFLFIFFFLLEFSSAGFSILGQEKKSSQ